MLRQDIDPRDLQRINRFIRRVVVSKTQRKIKPRDLLEAEKKIELAYNKKCKQYRKDIRPAVIADLMQEIETIKPKHPSTELNKETETQISTLIKQISEVGPDILLKQEYSELLDRLINENFSMHVREDSDGKEVEVANENANPFVLEIASAVYSAWQKLLESVIDIEQVDNQIKNNIPEVAIDIDSEGYKQLVEFLKNETNILPVVGNSAIGIIGDDDFSDFDDYCQLLNVIKMNITLATASISRVTSIPTFDLDNASRQWNNSNRKKVETRSNTHIVNQQENWGLKEKILHDVSTRDHLLRDIEIQSVINSLNLQDHIHISITNEDSIRDKLNTVITNAGEERPYTFFLILSDAKSLTKKGGHWTSAKLTVNTAHVAIEYADSSSFSFGCPNALRTAVENAFALEITESNQKDVIKQPSGYECGYLSLYNCIRHILKTSAIGQWSNQVSNIPILCELIQKIVLENLRLSKGEVQAVFCEADGEKLKFTKTFIEDLFVPKNDDSPLYQLTLSFYDELKNYKNNRTDSWTFEYDPDSYNRDTKSYTSRFTMAQTLVKALQNCTTNKELNEILTLARKYIAALNLTNASSWLLSILESNVKKILDRRLNEDVSHDKDAEEFFSKIHNLLRDINAGEHKVASDKYTWHGQEWLINDGVKTDEQHHTLKDQLFGKLYFIMSDEDMDPPTKITEMRIILAQFRAAVTPFLGDGSNFYRALWTLEEIFNSPPKISPTQLKSDKSLSLKSVKNLKNSNDVEASFPKELLITWSSGGKNEIDRIFTSLLNYAKADGVALLFSGDWKANNAVMAREALKIFDDKIQKGETVTPQDILDHFSKQINWEATNPCGKLMRLLRFIAVKTNSQFYVCLKKPISKSFTAG